MVVLAHSYHGAAFRTRRLVTMIKGRCYFLGSLAAIAVCALLSDSRALGQAPRQRVDQRQQVPRNNNRQVQNGQRPPGAPANVRIVPFRLTPAQQAELDRVLLAWERQSAKTKSLRVSFKLWEYDDVFKRETTRLGKLTYGAPDKGSYEIEGDDPERWVCDGDAVYEYNYEKKQLIERRLPPNLKGNAIASGPLPFLLGAKAAELKRRYFMRIVTPENVTGQIWIEARPRFREDAANFSRAELILKEKTLLPHAVQLHLPNDKTRTVHQFYDEKVNSLVPKIFAKIFAKPFTPPGWKRIVEEVPEVAQVPNPANTPPANNPIQARQSRGQSRTK